MTKDIDQETGLGKVCVRCGEWKVFANYGKQSSKKDGLRGTCKECMQIMSAGYRANNKEERNKKTREWRKKNPEKAKAAVRNWRINNPQEHKDLQKKWRSENPEKLKGYDKKRLATPMGKINASVRAGINKSIKRGTKGGRRRAELLGYTTKELMVHLEALFTDGMSWENYGEWHIDHIVPLAAHNFETPDDIDFKKAWSLSNLQPLWAADNMRKRAKLETPFQPSFALHPANDNFTATHPSILTNLL